MVKGRNADGANADSAGIEAAKRRGKLRRNRPEEDRDASATVADTVLKMVYTCELRRIDKQVGKLYAASQYEKTMKNHRH